MEKIDDDEDTTGKPKVPDPAQRLSDRKKKEAEKYDLSAGTWKLQEFGTWENLRNAVLHNHEYQLFARATLVPT